MQKQALLGLWGMLESTVMCLPVPAQGQLSSDKALGIGQPSASLGFGWVSVTFCGTSGTCECKCWSLCIPALLCSAIPGAVSPQARQELLLGKLWVEENTAGHRK